jgi:hypothetical protein
MLSLFNTSIPSFLSVPVLRFLVLALPLHLNALVQGEVHELIESLGQDLAYHNDSLKSCIVIVVQPDLYSGFAGVVLEDQVLQLGLPTRGRSIFLPLLR